jgi:hypothetical protein
MGKKKKKEGKTGKNKIKEGRKKEKLTTYGLAFFHFFVIVLQFYFNIIPRSITPKIKAHH